MQKKTKRSNFDHNLKVMPFLTQILKKKYFLPKLTSYILFKGKGISKTNEQKIIFPDRFFYMRRLSWGKIHS